MQAHVTFQAVRLKRVTDRMCGIVAYEHQSQVESVSGLSDVDHAERFIVEKSIGGEIVTPGLHCVRVESVSEQVVTMSSMFWLNRSCARASSLGLITACAL